MKDFSVCDWFELIMSSFLVVTWLLTMYFVICIFH
jgi:hypothetical protein